MASGTSGGGGGGPALLREDNFGVDDADDCVHLVAAVGGDMADALAAEAAREVACGNLAEWKGRARRETTTKPASEEGGLVVSVDTKRTVSSVAALTTPDAPPLKGK
jgi:hypothetical protein